MELIIEFGYAAYQTGIKKLTPDESGTFMAKYLKKMEREKK